VSSRASKRTQGAIQNIANQLAQIAAGWEASFDGPVLLNEPKTGRYLMDTVDGSSMVNGRKADLGMAKILESWLRRELARLGRDRGWVREATVEVEYELVPSDIFMDSHPGWWTSDAFVGRLSATAHVVTSEGAGEGRFENAQALAGQAADPVRPMPQYPTLPNALKNRWRAVQIKGPRRPSRSPDS
jgi:hypothetical protein